MDVSNAVMEESISELRVERVIQYMKGLIKLLLVTYNSDEV